VKRVALSLLMLAAVAVTVVAVEIPMRNGTVIQADGYTLTGSYIMLSLPNGQSMAYDVADVDVDALRAAEAAAEAAADAATAASETGPVTAELPGNRALVIPPEGEEAGGISITDQDVRRYRPEVYGDGDGAETGGEDGRTPSGPPPGYQEGGGVVLSNLRVTGLGEGRWLVEGDVINRSPSPVTNVRVQLQTIATGDRSPWSAEVPVTNTLAPDETGVFSREFSAAQPDGKTHPDIRAAVYWMGPAAESQQPPPGRRMPGPVGPVPTPRV
jgi:hypothetical protein